MSCPWLTPCLWNDLSGCGHQHPVSLPLLDSAGWRPPSSRTWGALSSRLLTPFLLIRSFSKWILNGSLINLAKWLSLEVCVAPNISGTHILPVSGFPSRVMNLTHSVWVQTRLVPRRWASRLTVASSPRGTQFELWRRVWTSEFKPRLPRLCAVGPCFTVWASVFLPITWDY